MLGVAVGPVNQESKGLRGTRLQFNEKRTEELYIVRNFVSCSAPFTCHVQYAGQRERERERERKNKGENKLRTGVKRVSISS